MFSRITFWGPLSRPGLIVALIACALDQVHKWWMLSVLGITGGQSITVAPFLDLVLVWNRGVSYGWFQQDSSAGLYVLVALTAIAVVALIVWLAMCDVIMVALALGLIIGGAVGNGADRLVHGAVADFFSFHAFGYRWYVFNLADVAIVAGVAILLYDAVRDLRAGGAGKSPN